MKSETYSLPPAAWLVLAPLLLLSGCAGSLEKPRTPHLIAIRSPDRTTGNYTLDSYRKDLGDYAKAVSGDPANHVAAAPTEAARLRNKMVYGIVAEIDFAFYKYETTLFLNEGEFHVVADFLQLGLAGASTISNGARTKTILSAVLSGVTGVNLSIDKNFFRQQTVQAICSSMEANRDGIKTAILKQLNQDKDNSAYPFDAARADLIHYFFAGTLASGLQQLGQNAANNAQAQKKALSNALTKVSTADVQSFTAVNQAVTKALTNTDPAAAAKDLAKVISFLQAMNVTIADNASKTDAETAYRSLAATVADDQSRWPEFFSEAKNARLIP